MQAGEARRLHGKPCAGAYCHAGRGCADLFPACPDERASTGVFEKTSRGNDKLNNPFGTKGALIHPCGRVRSAEGLSPHRDFTPRSDMAALPQQGAAPLAPLRGYPCTPTKTVHPPLASVPFLRVLLSYPGGDTHSHLPLEHRHCEPRKRQISRCRSRLPKRRKADKRVGRNDPRLHPQRRCCPYRNHAAVPRPALFL